MRKLIVALLAFWFAFGPVTPAWAQSATTPCESMGMSTPADDCCGEDMNQAKCLSACLSVSLVVAVSAPRLEACAAAAAPIPGSSFRRASVLAPPDAIPPKTPVS